MTKSKQENLPDIKDCIQGRVYKIRCRNLAYGVWNGRDGFIGIRQKFNSRFLFTELHWDASQTFGTVREAIDTGIDVPSGVELRTSTPTEDRKSGRLVAFDRPVMDGGRGWYYVDTNEEDQNIQPCSYTYRPLFEFLEQIEEESE